ncbi:GMC oxidoreductase [Agromyces aurantiacus]|uniref:Cholesterol oxidase n=1 Tax=Agromyces aurantiacus TaxID=165814 RepID=A0ABV9R1L8_9MICO|nr:GMC family oxidoreductase [Agromyces aurantiacus]MBM7502689.1 cholesterol oxidase [Agromyces aurantiacus]
MVESIERVDAVVIGSGFGGSVVAHRLAEGGRSVVLMERGRSYPPGAFARTPTEFGENFWSPGDELYGLFETWSFRGLEGVVSSGLGGGSLIYANVLLRKDPEWFVHDSPLPGGGYENWPISRDDLEPHYDRVEAMLDATPYPYRDTPKTEAFEMAARAAGHDTLRPPLAVTFADADGAVGPFLPVAPKPYGNLHGRARFTCSQCGECDIGCNYGAKNSLDHTYLSAAAHHGADLRTLHEVRGVRPVDDEWEVRYRVHRPGEGPPAEGAIRAQRVVLGAGTFGSTYLLLRNRASLRGLSPALGTRFCGNGDLIGFLMGAKEQIDKVARARRIAGSRGPVITSAIRVGDRVDGDGSTGRGYYVQEAGYPGFLNWLLETAQLRSVVSRSTRVALTMIAKRLSLAGESNISADLAHVLGRSSLSTSSLPVLGMGRDVPDGVMYLDRGRLAVDWTTATSLEYFGAMRTTMSEFARSLGARFVDNPLWLAKRVITVHPLGGAPMGRNEFEGVVDPWGEVWGHPGLSVVDGSAMPGPVGPNPSLTIAAFADRAADRMLESWPRQRRRRRPATGKEPHMDATTPEPEEPPIGPAPGASGAPGASPTSVAFTEQMKGFFVLGEGDPRSAAADARVRDERMMFELTITAPDIDAFVEGDSHEGVATGYLESDALGGRQQVERGWFNLFVGSARDDERLMKYRLWLTTDAGTPVTFVGFKEVRDDPGFDLWEDTTTLFVQVLDGHVPPPAEVSDTGLLDPTDPAVLGAGVLRIAPLDFAEQLTTFRTTGPGGAEAMARFGSLFLGRLWSTYGRLAKEEA